MNVYDLLGEFVHEEPQHGWNIHNSVQTNNTGCQ